MFEKTRRARWKTLMETAIAAFLTGYIIIFYSEHWSEREQLIGEWVGGGLLFISSISILLIIMSQFHVWVDSTINICKKLRGIYEVLKDDTIEHFNIFRK